MHVVHAHIGSSLHRYRKNTVQIDTKQEAINYIARSAMLTKK